MSGVKPIPQRELLAYRADLKNEIFRQIRLMFHRLGMNQKELAARLDIDEATLSRRLAGKHDMKIETFSDLARGMDCRIDVVMTPLADVIAANKSRTAAFLPTYNAPNTTLGMRDLSLHAVKTISGNDEGPARFIPGNTSLRGTTVTADTDV